MLTTPPSRLSQDHEPPPAFESVTAEAAETQKVKANTKPSNLATSMLIVFTSSIHLLIIFKT